MDGFYENTSHEDMTKEEFDTAAANGEPVELDVRLGRDVNDPFHEDNYNEIEFTQLSKIYDVLMTLVQLQSPIAAARLQDAHARGVLVGPSPVFTGEFLYDTANMTQTTASADIPKST